MNDAHDDHPEPIILEGQLVSEPPETNEQRIQEETSLVPPEIAHPGISPLNNIEPELIEDTNGGTSEPPDSEGSDLPADNAQTEADSEFDALRAITTLLLGGAIEGTSQLVTRLKQFEEQLREEADEQTSEVEVEGLLEEDELDRLRYAMVGLIMDAQSTIRRNLSLWARAFDISAELTNRVASPVTNSFLLSPIQRRIDRLAQKGEQSLARWIAHGRKTEPHSRALAKMTYNQIIDEFIDQLAENPELQDLVARQGISLAGEARDEVRERTVTADNLMEGIVRRILRRPPRKELPAPPPEVQRWAKMTLDEYKIEKYPEDSDA